MSVSLVVVNFHAAAALERMLALLENVDEVVVVDHSEDEVETARLRALGVDRVVVQANAGYGAGLNRGVAESHGDTLLLANPDLIVSKEAIDRLIDALAGPGVGIAAPHLVWDEAGRWAVPQAEDPRWWGELEARYLPRTARRRYLREQIRLWDAQEPTRTAVVSGTLMAVSRATFKAVGGFDPKYFLFFEENDFCRRVETLGLHPVVVPGARVHHAIGVSADSAAGDHFKPSLERYRLLWLPAWYTTMYPDPRPSKAVRPPTMDPAGAGPEARWVISPTDRFIPLVRGPLVTEADPGAPDFLPAPAARSWLLGILDGLRVGKAAIR